MPGIAHPSYGEVRPNRNLRSLYLTYLLIAIWAGVLPWLIPLSLFLPPVLVLTITLPILLLVIVLVWWTGAYYRTILYRLSEDGISWERGVWRRQAGFVPYNRIATVDVSQGPLPRLFGISMLRIQTKGHLAETASGPGLKMSGLADAESLRGFILGHIRSQRRIRVPEPSDNHT